MYISTTILSSIFFASTPALAVTFNLAVQYSGQSFFDGWDFKDGFDNTTNGAVNYLNQTAAATDNIAFVNSAGHAIIKIDNTTNIPDAHGVFENQLKRNSAFLTTSVFFPVGSLFIFDAIHLPFGCSVWPSFWTRGPNWPVGGEIDVLESINRRTNNQMTLHTLPGCVQAPGVQQLGTTVGTDCSQGANSSIGCTVTDNDQTSFGDGFNNAGGGVWATQFDDSGVFIWFWNRQNIPQSVSSATDTIDPSTFGEPSAAWPSSTCNIANSFTPQQLVLDVTLCGDFAGEPSIYTQTCGQPGVTADANTCYVENVNGTGSNYDNAYFEINYVKAFTLPNVTVPGLTTSGSTPSSTSGGSTPSSTGSDSNTTGGNGAPALESRAYATMLLSALVLPAVVLAML